MQAGNHNTNTRPFVFNPSNLQPPRSIRPLSLGTCNNLSSLQPSHVANSTHHITTRNYEASHPHSNEDNTHYITDHKNQPRSSKLVHLPTQDRRSREQQTHDDDVRFSDKGVLIRDSSDDDFSGDLGLSGDTQDQASLKSSINTPKIITPHIQVTNQGSVQPFDPELDADGAINSIRDMQEELNQLAGSATQLILDMESVINNYGGRPPRLNPKPY
ncbi:hypothetical protein COEREDRAFT_86998 [Coemansia reversa NRRL 1564]|uniref:Uncharacterized protein n=1 Tax=Coemansia reversa (strain ATCC 12441 / NRRL 1564) TaxID=763665 RepID=A0A2G5BB80_COERN|nr:hypothetical protein COEREDRAFT_86998 [Coemansia reversa NRRL 1564]|eukprot:PIA16274.1 hypothetical protein COEREDRAFT_86998 [Coemansia reversa NRRL 1564]